MHTTVIIGHSSNSEVQRVSERLTDSGANVHCMDLGGFVERYQVSYDPKTESGILNIGQQSLPFEKIYGVYWQNANPMNVQISREVMSALSPFFHCQSIRWVNSINAITYHQNKPRQLTHAKQLGATIPATFIGNQVEQAREFVNEHQEVIIKPVQGGELTRFLKIEERNPDNLRKLLNGGPVTLQANAKGLHIRSYVLGHHVLSAEIESDYLDYRSDPNADAEEYFLPKYETELARRICRGFGMAWCAIDWKYYRGTYYFLEANPCPQFAKFEDQTRYPIAGCIANMLLDFRSLN